MKLPLLLIALTFSLLSLAQDTTYTYMFPEILGVEEMTKAEYEATKEGVDLFNKKFRLSFSSLTKQCENTLKLILIGNEIEWKEERDRNNRKDSLQKAKRYYLKVEVSKTRDSYSFFLSVRDFRNVEIIPAEETIKPSLITNSNTIRNVTDNLLEKILEDNGVCQKCISSNVTQVSSAAKKMSKIMLKVLKMGEIKTNRDQDKLNSQMAKYDKIATLTTAIVAHYVFMGLYDEILDKEFEKAQIAFVNAKKNFCKLSANDRYILDRYFKKNGLGMVDYKEWIEKKLKRK